MHMLGAPTLPLVKNPHEIQNQHLLIGRSGIPISFRIFHSLLWSTQWQPTPVFLPGESHGWRSLMGYSPWGCKELDMTERLHFTCSSVSKESACSIGDLGLIPGLGRSPREGNGNPLQYSCLENPMDRGAWWATVHGVAKSRTRLSDFTHFTLVPCTILQTFTLRTVVGLVL